MLQHSIQVSEESLNCLLSFVATHLDDDGRPDHHKLAAMAFMPVYVAVSSVDVGDMVTVNTSPLGILLDFAQRFEDYMDPVTTETISAIRGTGFGEKLAV